MSLDQGQSCALCTEKSASGKPFSFIGREEGRQREREREREKTKKTKTKKRRREKESK